MAVPDFKLLVLLLLSACIATTCIILSSKPLLVNRVSLVIFARAGEVKAHKEDNSRNTYIYHDDEGGYDVPFINSTMWYRLAVRKGSERKVTEKLLALKDGDPKYNFIEDAFCPQSPYLKFKGKSLTLAYKPVIPGLAYIKCLMNPDLADDVESVEGVFGFHKGYQTVVVPLNAEQGLQLTAMKNKTQDIVDEEAAKLRKEEYVSVVSGPHNGRYGILMGAKNGALQVNTIRAQF